MAGGYEGFHFAGERLAALPRQPAINDDLDCFHVFGRERLAGRVKIGECEGFGDRAPVLAIAGGEVGAGASLACREIDSCGHNNRHRCWNDGAGSGAITGTGAGDGCGGAILATRLIGFGVGVAMTRFEVTI